MKKFLISVLACTFYMSLAHTHPGHGGVSTGGDSSLPVGVSSSIPLPIKVDFKGNVSYQFEWWGFAPSEDNHGDDDHHADHGNEGGLFEWEIEPIITLNADKFRFVISKQDHSLTEKSTDMELNSESGEFLVVEQKKIGFGLGVGFHGHAAVNTFLGFGLLPSMEVDVYAERNVLSREEANLLGKVKYPKSLDALRSWRKNDLMVYKVNGGITFSATGGISGLAAGVSYTASGDWIVSFRKTDESKVKVSVSKVKLHALSALIGTEFASINVGLFGSQDKNFSFEFDLENSNASIAYSKFLKGKFKNAEKLAQVEGIEGVLRLTKATSKSIGRNFGVSLSLPFLAALNYSRSNVQSFSQSFNFQTDIEAQVYTGVYSKNLQSTGVLSRRLHKLWMFAANYQSLTHVHENPEENHSWEEYGANVKWMFMRKKLKEGKIQHELDDLKRMTGFWKELTLNFPAKKVGLVKMEFDAMISDLATESLMELVDEENALEDLYEYSTTKINEFFEEESNPAKTCKVYKSPKICKKAKLRRTKIYVKKAFMLLRK